MQSLMEHKGCVVEVDGNRVDVLMTVESACASCRAKNMCAAGDSEDKTVSIVTDMAAYYRKGDRVVVCIEQGMGVKAVIYAYILPFLVLIVSLLVMVSVQQSEIVAGCTALGLTAVYYVVLYSLRHRLEREIVFELRKEE